jgi:hypothetical protein
MMIGDVCFWHETDMTTVLNHVRLLGSETTKCPVMSQNGHIVCAIRFVC